MLPWQSIKFIDLDKIHINRRGPLKKKNRNICSETAKNANFHFSHYKSMVTVSYSFPQSTDAKCGIWKKSASEEKSFENVDDGRMDDGCLSVL